MHAVTGTSPRPRSRTTLRKCRRIVAAVKPFNGSEDRLRLVHLAYEDDQLAVEDFLLWDVEAYRAGRSRPTRRG